MSKRLYLSDPYTTQFTGRIINRRETPAGPALVLEQTYFYPESGGQPHDLGTIAGIPVTRIIEEGEEILHLLPRLPDSDRVPCVIDPERRRDHMQQHNGQHILSAAFLAEADAQTLSFHLGSTTSTIDLDRAGLEPEVVAAVETKANRAVTDRLPIRSYYIEPEEAADIELRKAPDVEGILRIVEIEGFDRQACCGTHPANTAEVGPIFIRGLERLKKLTRVEFVCGVRALADYKASTDKVRSLTRVLNSPENELVETATKLVEEKKESDKTIRSLREELLEMRAAQWAADAEQLSGLSLVMREVPDVTPAELRNLAIHLTQEPSRVALLGARTEGRAHLIFARSKDAPAGDMSALLREALPSVEGKGGGSPHIAQGGGPHLDGLEEALAGARRSLASRTS